ncbi:acyl-CoA synthetase family member 3 [Lycorma delicatula]|uniref:acyl-CoA synthetase family member 3 n=1 Tax=Lycorma delicatula TaxID=130591 RepID=UPI003F51239C
MLPSSYRPTVFFLSQRCQHSYHIQQIIFKKHGRNGYLVRGTAKAVNTLATPSFHTALDFKDKIALKDRHGQYTYGRLLTASNVLANQFEKKIGDQRQQRIAFLCANDASYILVQWACWLAGNIAVPLSPLHPCNMLEYFVRDSDADLLVTTPEYENIIHEVNLKTGRPFIVLDNSISNQARSTECGVNVDATRSKILGSSDMSNGIISPVTYAADSITDSDVLLNNEKKTDPVKIKLPAKFYRENNAMIVYTSGTTSQPKGVVISHRNLDAQIKSMVSAWGWTSNDAILHTLPLHHIHGIVNALLCPLAVGARCVMLPSFDASEIWKQILGVKLPECERINIYMGVPTMYVKLIDKYMQSLTKNERMVDYVRAVCLQKMRLFVSGSAPLPTQVFDKWEYITGHKILERYGMTETGMILTNSLTADRKPGSVGIPFTGVQVKIVDNNGRTLAEGSSQGTTIVSKQAQNVTGELLVKGSSVFKEYYRKPDKTEEAFTEGWFKTGDHVQYDKDAYKILGRQSVDIIKTGGYKVSAVHVETTLRDYPDIIDVAVVGINDMTWGQKVAAVIETAKGDDLDINKLKEWAKSKLPAYEVPTQFCVVKTIPRNPLGKVNKKDLINVVFPEHNNKTA